MHAETDYKKIENSSNFIIDQGYIILESYCIDPGCFCNKVKLTFALVKSEMFVPDFSYEVSFSDLKPMNLFTYMDDNCPNPLRIVNEIINNPAYIRRFKAHYSKAKIYGLSHQVPKDAVNDNRLIPYNVLFTPDGFKKIEYHGQEYYLYDRYNPECNEMLLEFLSVTTEDHSSILLANYNFLDSKWNIENKACSEQDALGMIACLDFTFYEARYQAVKSYVPPKPVVKPVRKQKPDIKPSRAFSALLNQYTKERLQDRSKVLLNIDITGTKAEMIARLIPDYFLRLDDMLNHFTTAMLDYLFQFVDESQEREDCYEEEYQTDLLTFLLLVIKDNKTGYYIMSDEVLAYLKTADRKALYKNVANNNLYTQYAHALASAYGILPLSLLTDYLARYENLKPKKKDLKLLLLYDSLFRDLYHLEDRNIVDRHVFFVDELDEDVKDIESLDYAVLTREEILNTEKPAAEQALFDYLTETGIDEEYAGIFIDHLYFEIKNGRELDEVYEVTEELYVTNDELITLKKLIITLYETTRSFSLKGHIPNNNS